METLLHDLKLFVCKECIIISGYGMNVTSNFVDLATKMDEFLEGLSLALIVVQLMASLEDR